MAGEYGVGSKNSREPNLATGLSQREAYLRTLKHGAAMSVKQPRSANANWGKGGPAMHHYVIYKGGKFEDTVEVWQGTREILATSRKHFNRSTSYNEAVKKVEGGLD
jgi:hypothetical protein